MSQAKVKFTRTIVTAGVLAIILVGASMPAGAQSSAASAVAPNTWITGTPSPPLALAPSRERSGATSMSSDAVATPASASVGGRLYCFGGADNNNLNNVFNYVQIYQPGTVLQFLILNPSSLVGGSNSTGTVTLSAAAPKGGAVVALASSDSAVAQVPVSVTVPVGGTNAQFQVTTSKVTSPTTVTISATYNNSTVSATLLVTP